jgi:glycosyltransferase involved in cell wall biosynthesis
MKLGIKVFAAYYPPHRGGYERTVSELAERVAAAGHDVTVITCDLGLAPVRETRGGVRIYRLPSWQILGGTYTIPKPSLSGLRLLREALAGRCDLVHTHTRFFPTTALGMVISLLMRRPLVHTEHGAGHSQTGRRIVSMVNQIVDHGFGSLLMRYAHVIAISNAAADFCRHLGARKVEIIPDGVDIEVFHPRASSFRQKYGIGADETVVTFVGRLVWGKGVQDLLAAWPAYATENTRVVLVGDGPMREELEQAATRLGASVVFTGGLDTEGVCDTLAATDIFVSPTHTEGLGLTLIEAGAMGLPAVACGIEGVLDVVLDERSGVLVPVGDVAALGAAVQRLAHNPQLRRTMGAAAREHVRARFDWRTSAAAYITTFSRLYAARQRANGQPRLDAQANSAEHPISGEGNA